jgi:RNA recognition motif-containing protein
MAFVRQERNVDATLFVGELAEEVTEELVWELMLQAGPVSRVHLPKDKLSGTHQGYGFVEFATAEDADYALRVLNMVKLFGRSLRLNRSAAHQDARDIGANLYLGNLDPVAVDDKLLHDTFGAFGVIIKPPKVGSTPWQLVLCLYFVFLRLLSPFSSLLLACSSSRCVLLFVFSSFFLTRDSFFLFFARPLSRDRS